MAVLVMILPIGDLVYFNYPRIIYAVYPDLLEKQIEKVATTKFSPEVFNNIASPEALLPSKPSTATVIISILAAGVQTEVILLPAS